MDAVLVSLKMSSTRFTRLRGKVVTAGPYRRLPEVIVCVTRPSHCCRHHTPAFSRVVVNTRECVAIALHMFCSPEGDTLTTITKNKEAVKQLLQEGLAQHRSGRLHEAAFCYASVLEAQPRQADALNLLGVLARQQNDLVTSERLILAAVHQNASVATYHHHLAKTYTLQGRPQKAAQSYRQALSLNPDDVDSMQLLATLLGEAGEWEPASALYAQLLEREPQKTEWCYRLGQALKGQGRMSEALVFYRQAVLLHPNVADGHFNLGRALFEAQHRSESVQCFRRVLALEPDDAEAYNYLAQILHECGDVGQAKQAYLEALRYRPDFVEALANLGALLMEMSALNSAEALLRRAVQLAPDFSCAHSNLGTVLARQGRFVEAFESFRRVLLNDPSNAVALSSMGFSLDALGDLEGARECFKLALKADPDSALLRFNLSSHLLLEGNFAEGWSWYECRWEVRQFTGKPRAYAQPRWQGEDIAGGSIFLFAEQGLGDTLQFARYALLLVERGAQVFLEVQPALGQLLRTLHPAIKVLIKDQEEVPATDWYCPLLSLPKVFGTDLSNVPATVPYLHADKEKAKQWARRLHVPGLRVGVVWCGNPEHTRDRLRSIPFAQFRQLMGVAQTSVYSLQKGGAAIQVSLADAEPALCDLDSYLLDFTDTAAVVANLDLVITVDTAVAHLAGAMGKPVWILLAHAPDWRWLTVQTESPWYPTARLFRQSSPGDWGETLVQVKKALSALVSQTVP